MNTKAKLAQVGIMWLKLTEESTSPSDVMVTGSHLKTYSSKFKESRTGSVPFEMRFTPVQIMTFASSQDNLMLTTAAKLLTAVCLIRICA